MTSQRPPYSAFAVALIGRRATAVSTDALGINSAVNASRAITLVAMQSSSLCADLIPGLHQDASGCGWWRELKRVSSNLRAYSGGDRRTWLLTSTLQRGYCRWVVRRTASRPGSSASACGGKRVVLHVQGHHSFAAAVFKLPTHQVVGQKLQRASRCGCALTS